MSDSWRREGPPRDSRNPRGGYRSKEASQPKVDDLPPEEWLRRERVAQRKTEVLRVEHRYKSGRDTFIDHIHYILFLYEEDVFSSYPPFPSEAPWKTVTGMPDSSIEGVMSQIEALDDLGGAWKKYWPAVNAQLKDELRRRHAPGASFIPKVDTILEHRSGVELDIIERDISAHMSDDDTTYWDAVAERLPMFRLRIYLKDIFERAREVYAELNPSSAKDDEIYPSHMGAPIEPVQTTRTSSGLSPRGLPISEFADRIKEIKAPDVDAETRSEERGLVLARLRREYKKLRSVAKAPNPSEVIMDQFELFVRDEQKDLGEDDDIMTDETEVFVRTAVTGDWSQKYEARRPRYFNRVKMGFDWNKYNQTHYDHSNPPPKQVQGYRFNIFCPDLLRPDQPPKWVLESDSSDTVIIRFSPGPPFEDVAFKIVNREWDLNYRKGFKNVYDRGILQLYFNFKKYRYRK